MNINLVTEKFNINLFTKEIKNSTIISVDTEFIREKTYYPILSLIQIGVNNQVFLFDCLSTSKNVEPLKKIFIDNNFLKIFHDCEQDIEIIKDSLSIEINNFFDTQLGNAFIDQEHHISYKNLVKKYLNIEINKDLQTSNWMKRPLTRKQIQYAASDVVYLEKIYKKILETLIKEKKINWFLEEVKHIQSDLQRKSQPKYSWEKIKINDPSKIDMKLLMKLSKHREETSRARNIPKSWYLKDKDIIKLCSKNYDSLDNLKKEKLSSNRNFSEKDYLNLIRKFNLNATTTKSGFYKRKNVKKEQKILKSISEKLKISQPLIANKRDLEKNFAENDFFVEGWRKEIFEIIKQETNK